MGQRGVYEREGEEHDLLVVGNEGSVLGLGICSASFAVWALHIGRKRARRLSAQALAPAGLPDIWPLVVGVVRGFVLIVCCTAC